MNNVDAQNKTFLVCSRINVLSGKREIRIKFGNSLSREEILRTFFLRSGIRDVSHSLNFFIAVPSKVVLCVPGPPLW
jgi:hypothetical protein